MSINKQRPQIQIEYKEWRALVFDAETVKLIELTRVVTDVASLSRDVKKQGSVSV